MRNERIILAREVIGIGMSCVEEVRVAIDSNSYRLNGSRIGCSGSQLVFLTGAALPATAIEFWSMLCIRS